MKPLNKYIQIEPEEHKDFISSVNSTYDEIGTVIELPEYRTPEMLKLQKGDRVFFDSWMAAKFPAGEGKHYWLVPFDNIKAYAHTANSIPEQPMQDGVSSQLHYRVDTEKWSVREMPAMRHDDVLPEQHAELEVPVVPHPASPAAERSDVSKGVS